MLRLEAKSEYADVMGRRRQSGDPARSLVYCVEKADNGAPLASLSIAEEANLTEREVPHLFGGCVMVEGDGLAADGAAWPEDQPWLRFKKSLLPCD